MKSAILSTVISSEVKGAVTKYCRSRGLKLGQFIEQALVECLEDQLDIEICETRRDEASVPLAKVLSERKKRKV